MIRGNLGAVADLNTAFRRVVHTGRHCQLAVSCLSIGEELGEILYETADQIIVVIRGRGEVLIGEEPFPFVEGDFVVVPAGVPFDVMNRGETELKFLALLTPPVYPEATVHETRQAALNWHEEEMAPAG